MNSTESGPQSKIVIAGASGYIGRNLGRSLRSRANGKWHVTGLTRVPPAVQGDSVNSWRSCDLFSLSDTERALEGMDYAFYLVHSMLPSARLTQGNFWDFDLIAAEHFARAAKKAGIKQIIYLGGIVPGQDVLSRHLQSRHEVEVALKSHGVPVTTLRAGLVVGAEGSSFLIFLRMIQRMPIMLHPKWSDTLSHPIALQDTIKLLEYCLGNTETFGQTYDIGGPELLSYRAMRKEIATQLGRKVPEFNLHFNTDWLTKHYVSLLSGAPGELVSPLIDSLRYPIVARKRKLNMMAGVPGITFRQAVREAIAQVNQRGAREEPIAFQKSRGLGADSRVRSLQRYPLPQEMSAEWVARQYFWWLPKGLKYFTRIEIENDLFYSVYMRFIDFEPLLRLEFSAAESGPDRWLFYIRGGLLAKKDQRGSLEFCEVLNRQFVLVAINDYKPRLPWYIYRFTQAVFHLWVMGTYKKYLNQNKIQKKN